MKRPHGQTGEPQAGWALLELLLCSALLGVLAVTAMPAVQELYLGAAVEYETECLYSDIRKLQVLSRTTCYNKTGPERPVQQKRTPSLSLSAAEYSWWQGPDTFQRHKCLPGVQLAVDGPVGGTGSVIAFTADSWPDKRLMTIYVFTEGRKNEGRRIRISNGRVRVERGNGN